MIQDEDEIEWFEVWLVDDGDVVHHNAYEDDDQIVLEGDEERYDLDDPRSIHVDDLTEGNGIFDNEAAAKAYAIKWMTDKIFEYQLKLGKLHGTNSVG